VRAAAVVVPSSSHPPTLTPPPSDFSFGLFDGFVEAIGMLPGLLISIPGRHLFAQQQRAIPFLTHPRCKDFWQRVLASIRRFHGTVAVVIAPEVSKSHWLCSAPLMWGGGGEGGGEGGWGEGGGGEGRTACNVHRPAVM